MDRASLLFDTVMSIKYHRRRATFLERASAVASTTILISGAAAFVAVVGDRDMLVKALSALITGIAIVQVVFQMDRCAAEHRAWLKRWMAMRKDIERTPQPTQDDLSRWNGERLDIESECVGEMRALQEDCYNRALSELDRDGEKTRLRLRHRVFMQVFSFENGFTA